MCQLILFCDACVSPTPLESDLHLDQIELLLACLKWYWQNRSDFYASGNITIDYSEDQITTRDFRGSDFFVVKGCENYPRRSWMVWKEGHTQLFNRGIFGLGLKSQICFG